MHIHTAVDVPPPALDAVQEAAEEEDDDQVLVEGTRIIARVDGIHTIDIDESVSLAVRTHLMHFFDPTSGGPLR